jgi:cell surface protein SprA
LEKLIKNIIYLSTITSLLGVFLANPKIISNKENHYYQYDEDYLVFQADTPPPDTGLTYPFEDNNRNPFFDNLEKSPLYMSDPANVKTGTEYDPESNEYTIYNRIGEMNYKPPVIMSFEEYIHYDYNHAIKDYWKERSKSQSSTGGSGILSGINLPPSMNKIAEVIDIRPQGSAELIFGINHSRRDDPALDEKRRKTTNFDFQEKIQMNVMAKIGDKIEFGVKYNTEASFDFENKMKLQYEGKEDEIIKKIEAGDVTMPINSTLITGSQSLFGIKTELQFGNTTVTSVISQQESETSNITVDGGAQTSEFEVKADEYEENKHFFIAQYFRDNYTKSLQQLPIVSSPINITKMEVWLTNIGPATQENRNIVAFSDLGENDPYSQILSPIFTSQAVFPQDNSNNLYSLVNINTIRDLNNVNNYLTGLGFNNSEDYEKVENARLLSTNEYSYNSKLGFISLNSSLNSDQVLAVAYQYTIIGQDSVYQVGEFSNGGIVAPNCLSVKLLKSTAVNTQNPMWDLMMKNVYSIGGYQINPDDFRLNILYTSDENGVPTGYITEGDISGQALISVLNLDNVNVLMDPESDGVFDFIDGAATSGGTIESRNGRVYFPVLEPFGEDLRKAIGDNATADKFCYDSLYTMTKSGAQQYPSKNKFLLQGFFKSSSSSEISLNAMNIPQGSVKVTAGGIPLTENVDYTVDYTLGRVKIINEGILNSGTPINISLESNSLFSIQTKTLLGTHIDHRFSDNFNAGFTIMNLTERPLTQKVNYGDEPISNTIWGMNSSYQTESLFITKMLDFLPFYSTKTPSTLRFDGEFANLIPGHARAVGKDGVAYIDDFEGSTSGIDMKNVGTWHLASTPQGQISVNMFPEAASDTSLSYGFNRALLNWYVVDPLFTRSNNLTPDHIKDDPDAQSNHYVREILEQEVFPAKESANNTPTNLAVLNLSYYPEERGPYNFDVAGVPGISRGINPDGTLKDPETRWGGIMRKIESTDFEETNIEYIEFWMLDPFIYNPTHTGGQMYFNLGDISEDVLKDSRKSYENGLPTSNVVQNVDTTHWGRVPTLQALVNAFDNDPSSREFQDVGLDGLSDADELTFFETEYLNKIAIEASLGTSSQAYQYALNDPSADNFNYYRDSDYDNNQVDIIDRYKMYNGLDGNSPTSEQSTESYPTSATTLPNEEDINRDNTLSESERYFQYVIDLQPEKMIIGENYITDIREAPVNLKNGNQETVKWYQFKIPVKSPDQVVGNIQDFKSIRFMRIYMKNFEEEVTCRFATMELVRSSWRKYNYSLLSPGEYIPNDEENGTTFDISSVNIEENGERDPIPYVLPPEILRETNLGTTNLQQLNEQSLVLKVCNLIDGDARATYKTTEFDLRRYEKLKMFVHAEEVDPGNFGFADGDVTVFIRLGADFTNNYYEYEIPLTPTAWGTPKESEDEIWPESNAFEIELDKLVNVKMNRNIAMRQKNSVVTLSSPFVEYDEANKITVVGIPNLSDVETIMIGIRNPKHMQVGDGDDGAAKCAEIWVNELRLTDFDEDGGWAAIGRVNIGLADLGNVILAGNFSTAGFGSIEQSVNERQMESVMQYDVATNLELGKFLPEKSGIKIPMHFDISENFTNPQYNPLNPDILLKEDLATYDDRADRDSIKEIVQDYTRRKSINFMNVKKTRTGANSSKPRIYDIENFNFTYAYTEVFHRNIDIEYDLRKTYRGAIGYNFANNPKNYRPFSKIKFFQKYKSFALIRDFNFFLMPKLLAIRTDVDREYSENLLRNKSEALLIIEPTYVKTFNWNRYYDFKYDFSKSLKFDFTAQANARIDEPPGKIDKGDVDYKTKRDSIMYNVKNFGRVTNYHHAFNINYNIPINKIPLFNWISASARYSADFTWAASPLYKDSLDNLVDHPFGNTIENSNNIQLTFNSNFTNLYNKIPYLKKVNQEYMGNRQGKTKNNKGNNIGLSEEEEDSLNTEEEKVNYFKIISDHILLTMMGVKNFSFTYSQGNGTLLPGFKPSPTIMGQDLTLNAPGWMFVAGGQQDIRSEAVKNGWLTSDTTLNTAYARKFTENFNARATIEPIKNFRIEVTANRNFSSNSLEYFRADGNGDFHSYSPQETGNFSVSYITWNTAFLTDKENYSNEAFENFKDYRIIIAQNLANQNPSWNGNYVIDSITGLAYPEGYGPTSQSVLIPAFLAAYSGNDINNASLSPFPKIPLPNWRVTYNGLTKIDFFKKYFKTFTLSHSYRSSYNVGSYTTNVLFNDPDQDGFTAVRDAVGNFLPGQEIAQITIMEQFSPLINFDMTWHNSFLSKFEIKKTRNLALSFANNQLTEVTSSEFIIGVGYRFKDVKFKIRTGGSRRTMESDLNIKADFSMRTNRTILRKIVEDVNQISAGQRIISINTSADYQLSQRFVIRLFYDHIITNPYVSSQFPTGNVNAGISLRFTLAQ